MSFTNPWLQEKSCTFTRWALTGYKWISNPYKWPYKWVTLVITPISKVITPTYILVRGHFAGCLRRRFCIPNSSGTGLAGSCWSRLESVQKRWLLLERNYPNVVFQPSFSGAMLVLGRAFWERFFKTWKQIAAGESRI